MDFPELSETDLQFLDFTPEETVQSSIVAYPGKLSIVMPYPSNNHRSDQPPVYTLTSQKAEEMSDLWNGKQLLFLEATSGWLLVVNPDWIDRKREIRAIRLRAKSESVAQTASGVFFRFYDAPNNISDKVHKLHHKLKNTVMNYWDYSTGDWSDTAGHTLKTDYCGKAIDIETISIELSGEVSLPFSVQGLTYISELGTDYTAITQRGKHVLILCGDANFKIVERSEIPDSAIEGNRALTLDPPRNCSSAMELCKLFGRRLYRYFGRVKHLLQENPEKGWIPWAKVIDFGDGNQSRMKRLEEKPPKKVKQSQPLHNGPRLDFYLKRTNE